MSSSPPIARAVAVLNFLGGHSGQAFTLTEISKSLRISSATCHNLLGALVDAGYVYRTAAKTYVIGPAVSRLAQVTLPLDVLMQVVRPEMRLLADEFDVVCSASFLEGDKIVVHERAAALSHIAWDAPGMAPQRFAPPVGNIFLAWAGDEVLARWMDSGEPPLSAQDREDVMRALEFLRANRYAVGVRIVPLDSLERALELRNRSDMTDYYIASVDPEASYNLAYISAPVFGRAETVAFGLSLLGFVRPLEGKAVLLMAKRLRAAADRIGSFIAGRSIVNPGSFVAPSQPTEISLSR
ncbi:hypothetical protein MB02_11900 [Croceicoccus estronivorus]|uniref:IclR family transcriptional regulator n=1 Tax=Croceicoccus estronivorus TaxID=1172626 RepID=UPI000830E60F|nr:helix-turn-helix domain-containing protein [Croceicoccus estronivorus]OCC23329.1 hypothetical protein MB02_11900 [Croceicoccus estronivorus]